jgi:hypothetical protein
VSDWNLYLEHKLSLDLGVEAGRLADAIARETLGYYTRQRGIGQELLRGPHRARLHGMSFERARDELVEKGLIRFTRGKRGRGGHRDTYELLVEKPAEERDYQEPEKPATKPATKPAPERGRIEEGGREDQDLLTGASDATGAASPPAESTDVEDAWDDLLQILPDADEHTRTTFLRYFAALTAPEIHYVRDEILKRANGYRDNDPLETPSGYAYELLKNRLGGYNGTPDLPNRAEAA